MDSGSSNQSSFLENIYDEGQEYFVERIICRRIHNGQLEYLVKWQDFPEEDNTWELSTNLDCLRLIADFELSRFLKNNKRKLELEINELYEEKAKKFKIEPSALINNAFDCGHEAEEILSASNINGKIVFVIQFRNLDHPEKIDSQLAYAYIPLLVIEFYEKQLINLNAFANSLPN